MTEQQNPRMLCWAAMLWGFVFPIFIPWKALEHMQGSMVGKTLKIQAMSPWPSDMMRNSSLRLGGVNTLNARRAMKANCSNPLFLWAQWLKLWSHRDKPVWKYNITLTEGLKTLRAVSASGDLAGGGGEHAVRAIDFYISVGSRSPREMEDK